MHFIFPGIKLQPKSTLLLKKILSLLFSPSKLPALLDLAVHVEDVDGEGFRFDLQSEL